MQDADRLDALGAIGVGRTFTYGGAKGRGLADTIRHFEEKLVKLEGMMKTGEGKRMARVRSERISMFMQWWGEEMGAATADVSEEGAEVGGDGVGVGDVGMGGGGMGSETAPGNPGARDEDPGRHLMGTMDDEGEDEGSSEGETSSDSA